METHGSDEERLDIGWTVVFSRLAVVIACLAKTRSGASRKVILLIRPSVLGTGSGQFLSPAASKLLTSPGGTVPVLAPPFWSPPETQLFVLGVAGSGPWVPKTPSSKSAPFANSDPQVWRYLGTCLKTALRAVYSSA